MKTQSVIRYVVWHEEKKKKQVEEEINGVFFNKKDAMTKKRKLKKEFPKTQFTITKSVFDGKKLKYPSEFTMELGKYFCSKYIPFVKHYLFEVGDLASYEIGMAIEYININRLHEYIYRRNIPQIEIKKCNDKSYCEYCGNGKTAEAWM